MAAFFALLALVVAGGAVWWFVLRDEEEPGGVTLSAAVLDFGEEDLGKRSAAREVTLANDGASPLTIVSVAIDGPNAKDFRLTDATTCSADSPVESGDSCVVAVSFKPGGRGERAARVVIRLADGPGPQSLELKGSGIGEPAVVLETTRLDFGSVGLGQGKRTRQLTLTNAGNAPLELSTLAIDGRNADDFRLAKKTGCSTAEKVKAGGTCTIAVTFAPREPGKRSAVLVIEHDGAGGPLQVALAGEGTGKAEVVLDPGSVDFGEVGVGGESDPAAITLRNAGTVAFTVADVALTGDAADDYRLGGDCATGDRVEPGARCTIEVVFAPAGGGERTAAIEVTSGAGRVSAVELTGIGLSEETETGTTE